MFAKILKGFLSLIPIITVLAIFDYFFELIKEFFNFLFGFTNNNLLVTITIFTISILLLYYIGDLVEKNRKFILLKLTELIVDKIPIIKSIYKVVKDIIDLFSSGSKDNYLGVAYVKVGEGKMLGFITKKVDTKLTIFVPTTPNPTTGLLLFIDEKDVEMSDLSTEEAFKTIISIGINRP